MSTDRAGIYLIGIAAELAGMHPQTLRMYERRGLINPARSAGRTRRYSDADVALLRRIQELSEQGLNLAGIERVMALEARCARAERRARSLQLELDSAREEHRAQMEHIRRSNRAELVRVVHTETALVPLRPAHRGGERHGR
ncbi:MAG: MerR family transcriptional regulator [Thermoleophilia bacterium]